MLYKLDKAGNIFSERISKSQTTTVNITDIIKVGNSSIKFKLEVWIDYPSYGEDVKKIESHFKAIETTFICVAVNSKGRPKK